VVEGLHTRTDGGIVWRSSVLCRGSRERGVGGRAGAREATDERPRRRGEYSAFDPTSKWQGACGEGGLQTIPTAWTGGRGSRAGYLGESGWPDELFIVRSAGMVAVLAMGDHPR